jgi:hypothetical protein
MTPGAACSQVSCGRVRPSPTPRSTSSSGAAPRSDRGVHGAKDGGTRRRCAGGMSTSRDRRSGSGPANTPGWSPRRSPARAKVAGAAELSRGPLECPWWCSEPILVAHSDGACAELIRFEELRCESELDEVRMATWVCRLPSMRMVDLREPETWAWECAKWLCLRSAQQRRHRHQPSWATGANPARNRCAPIPHRRGAARASSVHGPSDRQLQAWSTSGRPSSTHAAAKAEALCPHRRGEPVIGRPSGVGADI